MQRFDLVVIGSGPGEQRAAIHAAKLGGSVAIVERATEVGGVVGLEYGSMLAALGVGVTRVDQRTQFLEMVERELVDAFCTRAREMGLTLRLGAAPPRGWHSSMPGSGRMTAGRSR